MSVFSHSDKKPVLPSDPMCQTWWANQLFLTGDTEAAEGQWKYYTVKITVACFVTKEWKESINGELTASLIFLEIYSRTELINIKCIWWNNVKITIKA